MYDLFTHCLFQCVINFTFWATMPRSISVYSRCISYTQVRKSTTLRNLQTLRYKSLPCGIANKIFVSFIQEVLATTTTIFHLTVIIFTCISYIRYTSSNSTTVHETFISVHTTRHLAHFPLSQEETSLLLLLLQLFFGEIKDCKKAFSIQIFTYHLVLS